MTERCERCVKCEVKKLTITTNNNKTNNNMQTTTNTAKSTKRYLSILADGKFHESVPAGTPGAVVREYDGQNYKCVLRRGTVW